MSFVFSLGFDLTESFSHLCSDLFRRFQIVIEFLLVDLVLSCKKLGKLGLSLLQVHSLTSPHVLNAVFHDVLLNQLASLGLPVRLMSQVMLATDVIHLLCLFLIGHNSKRSVSAFLK